MDGLVISVDTKKRSWSGISRTRGANGGPRGFRGCARPRFPDQGVGARCSLRRLRPRRKQGLLSAWASTTIRRLSRCRRFAVGGSRLHQILQRQTPRHHRRRRRLEWFTGSPVETRVAAPRRRTRPRHRSSPLPAGNEQMEQGLSPRRRGSSIACSRSSR